VDREIQQRHYEQQQKEIARMEAFIEQQRRWNRERNIIAAESRLKAIERMEKIEAPKNLPEKIRIKFKSGLPAEMTFSLWKSGKIISRQATF